MAEAWQLEMNFLRRRLEALEDIVLGIETDADESDPVAACEYEGDHSCALPAGHADQHWPIMDQERPTFRPVPKWRKLVLEQHEYLDERAEISAIQPLPTVLTLLSNVSHDDIWGLVNKEIYIARIIALCEKVEGENWTANPDENAPNDPDNYERRWIGLVLYMFANWEGQILWADIGNICAGWLEELTK